MRITGGTHRGRQLTPPPDDQIRPTADKTRLAIFNMIESRGLIRNAIVIDIFCGTGALGLESLSRGAASCTFIDQSPVAGTLTRQNATTLKYKDQVNIIQATANNLLERPASISPATLVFMDPPYYQNLVIPTLAALTRGNWVNHTPVFYVIETEKEWIPDWPTGYQLVTAKTYGITAIYLVVQN